MLVFGITGNFASGKTTVARLLKAKGVKVYDADKRIHQWYKDKNTLLYKKVSGAFSQFLGERREILCRKLGEFVFSNPKERDKLEKIVHPAVIKDLKSWIKDNQKKPGVFAAEVPLLFEKHLERWFDGIILVSAVRKDVFLRARRKFGLSAQDVNKRLRLFIPDSAKKKKADFVVNNRGGAAYLKREVDVLWNKIKEIYL